MSFTRLNWDSCTYKHDLKQAVGSADYMLNPPRIECRACFSTDPAIRMSSVVNHSTGIATCSTNTTPLIDIDSELKIINRKLSNCPTDQYLPSTKPYCTLSSFPDCKALPREDTRLSNPACTLRCSGWNRWEWLCQNPQDKSLIPFDYNINNRLIVKDNHRPCLPTPLSQTKVLPFTSDDVYVYKSACKMQPNTDVPSTTWKQCDGYNYVK